MLRSIRRGATIEGLYRKDVYELPPEALREAIVNAVAHRDYRLHACIQVSVSPGRVEVLSPGALFDGLTKEEMLEGKSRLRNPLVADVFHKMAIIEKWGTGIRRMFALCRKSGVAAPVVSLGASTVSVSFPRPGKGAGEASVHGETAEISAKGKEKSKEKGKEKGGEKSKEKIVAALSANPRTTTAELAALTGLSVSGVEKNLRGLKAEGRIQRVGPDRGGYWMVVDGDGAIQPPSSGQRDAD